MRFAFELAVQRNKKKRVTSITKSNAQGYSMVLWDRTFNDVAAQFPDATELAEGLVKRVNRTSALVHGLNRVNDVARFLNAHLELESPDQGSNTVNGVLQERLGRIPRAGDALALPGGLSLEVQSDDGRMAVRVLAKNTAPSVPVP